MFFGKTILRQVEATNYNQQRKTYLEFLQAPIGVLAPMSADTQQSAQPPINASGLVERKC